MPFTKGTVEISVFCEYAVLRLIYVGIGENIRVQVKGVDD